MRNLVSAAILVAMICLLAALMLLSRTREPSLASPQPERAPSAASKPEALRTAPSESARSEPAIETTVAATQSEPTPQAVIAGVVRVKGYPPQEPITLRLTESGTGSSQDERRTATKPGGPFAFAGLPTGFHGKLQVPRRYSISSGESGSRSLSVEAPREDLVLELEPRPCLTGRLVSQGSDEPVAAAVMAFITWADGSQAHVGADLEAGGRFFVTLLEHKTLLRVSLEATAEPGLRGSFEFAREEIPQDLDLGELVLTPGLRARLIVLDPERRPVAGARVRARGPGATPQETDSEGRVTLEGLSPDATLQVLARGFDPMQLPAPASGELVELVLERANRLTLHIVDSKGQPEPAVWVRLAAGEHMFLQTDSGPDPFLVPQVPKLGALAGQEGNRLFAMFLADGRGLVELQSIQPGLPLTLSIEDELGFSVHEEPVVPLRAHEERELTIRLGREPSGLAGRVEDALGQPLERAQVLLSAGHDPIVRTTGADGHFQFSGLHAAQASLRVELRGYVSAWLPEVPIPAAAPLRIVLDPSRDVLVSVVDPRGGRITAGTLSAQQADGREWSAVAGADGLRHLRDLPQRELEVRLRFAGSELVQALGAYAEELELRVPLLGRLEVSCQPGPQLPKDRLGLYLRSLDDQAVEQWLFLLRARSDPAVFEAVLPGAYELSFATWHRDGAVAKIVSLSTPLRVQVEPAVTTRVDL